MLCGGHLEGMDNLFVTKRIRDQKGTAKVENPQREDDGTADGDQSERQPLAEPDVPGAACGDGADRGGEPDDDQRPGGGLGGRLPEQVDEHRDGEDRSPAPQGSQRQADEQPGAGRDDQHRDQASGPTIGRPAGAALSNSSSTATR